MGQGRPWPLSTERIVKYIANSAAKNISSLDNQMMVPTLTRFGRLAGVRGTGSVTDAVATKVIITTPRRGRAADPPTSPTSLKKTEGAGAGSRPWRPFKYGGAPRLSLAPLRRGTGGAGGIPPGEVPRVLSARAGAMRPRSSQSRPPARTSGGT